ncbi:hypothetical protein OSTOST_23551, partial [Ostertagia ostertagi]
RCFVLCAVLAIVPSVFVPICTTARTFLLAIVIRVLQDSRFFRVSDILPPFMESTWLAFCTLRRMHRYCLYFRHFPSHQYEPKFSRKAPLGRHSCLVNVHSGVRLLHGSQSLPHFWSNVPQQGGFAANCSTWVFSVPKPPRDSLNTSYSFGSRWGLFSKACVRNTDVNKMRFFNSLSTVPSGVLFAMIGLFNPELQPASVTCHGEVEEMKNRFLRVCPPFGAEATWAAVLILHGAILVLTNVVFCVFASAEPADWTKDGYEDSSIRPAREDPLPQRPL